MTRTLSLSHQQNSPGLFIGRGKVPRKIQRERGSLGSFLRPDHRTGATSLVMHFLKVRGGGCLCVMVGKAEKSHCKGPGCGEGKTVVICANYPKDGWVFLQSHLKRLYRIKSLLSKKLQSHCGW